MNRPGLAISFAALATLALGLAATHSLGDEAKSPKADPNANPTAGAGSGAAVDDAPLGGKVKRFTFFDFRYGERSLDDFKDRKAFVLVFATNACPIAARYLPRLAELERTYRPRGVQFLAVNEGRGETVVELCAAAVDAGLEFPAVKDLDGNVARAVGATRTPEAVVLDAERRLRYRGRIDAQYRTGGETPDRGREDLREAVEDVLAGRDVREPETTVDGCRITFPAPPPPPDRAPTFAESVSPILRRRCETCHREGGQAPFTLASYEDATKHASMLAEVVELGRMPPWFADPRTGHFPNDRSLTPEERRTLIDWAHGGTPAGDLTRLPPPIEWPTGKWKISKPDLVLSIPMEVKVPAQGFFPYQYSLLHQGALLPYIFTEDTWVEEIQILPRNRRALHHANLFYADVKNPRRDHHFITGVVPGGDPMRLDPGVAFLVPRGSVLGLQMHYVPTGQEEADRISVGLVFAKHVIRKRLHHHEIRNNKFEIPAHAPAYPVVSRQRLDHDTLGCGMYVHMHMRGRDMRFVAKYPDGTSETLLLVPNYSFDWQLAYVWGLEGKRFPAGTVIECTAHYDNTSWNAANPNPNVAVRFGLDTVQEMMYGFFFYMEEAEDLQLTVDPATGRVPKQKAKADPAPGAGAPETPKGASGE
ncbi:MAG: redoxin domain-containing protein [Planctomycetes bacterium]|nr:redoxin domain-containing protein [Planctomycetota bacterium]